MKSAKSIDPIFLLLLPISIFFLFANLGNSYLWTDEAQSAILSRNILTFGYPRTFDGINTLKIFGQNWDHFGQYGKYYLWTVQPWLPFYITAASFALFRVSTFFARLPFVIFGLGSILLTYLLAQKLFQNRTISRISTMLLVLSVPYLLHMRQSHYYALLPFFSLWLILAYLRFIEQRKFAILEIIISSTLLFHSNYGAFVSVTAAMFIHYLIFHFDKRDIGKLSFVITIVSLLTIPWFYYLKPLSHVTELSFNNLRRQLEFYVRTINKYIFPLAFFTIVSLFAYFKSKIRPFAAISGKKDKLWLIALIIFVHIFMLIFVEQRIIRYMIHIVPFLYIVQGVILANWFKRSRVLTTVVFIILISSNLFSNPKIKFPIFDFITEITHDYDGPNEGIVKFLGEHAKKGDHVKVPYADSPIIFYAKDIVVDYEPAFSKNESFPEWIIPRQHWVSQKLRETDYFQKILSSYQRIEINYPDLQWGNRPEPGYHKYRTVTDSPKIVIFKRRPK